jgi:hypothetical protein
MSDTISILFWAFAFIAFSLGFLLILLILARLAKTRMREAEDRSAA